MLVSALVMAVGGQTINATIIYVDDTAPATSANDGTSWDNAFFDLHDGLKAVQSGDEVRIAQGVYKPASPGGDPAISFKLVSGVTIQGGYAGFGAPEPNALDPKIYETVLSGDLTGSNSEHVVRADRVSGAILQGVTITDGVAGISGAGLYSIDSELAIKDCRIIGNVTFNSGAGVSAQGGMLSIANVDFVDNQCISTGGGGTGLVATQCDVRDSHFESNVAQFGHGGAAFVGPGSRVERCVFINNEGFRGGGLWLQDAIAIDCLFFNNNSNEYGGALSSGGDDQAVNCRFIGNISDLCGGSVYNPQGSLVMVNCAFSGNEAEHQGGAIRSENNLTLINCSIVGNLLQDDGFANAGGGVYAAGQFVALNTIFWDNLTPKGSDAEAHQIELAPGAQATISNCCIMGWTDTLGGENNSGDDPQFIDADGPDNDHGTEDDNPRLSANSPAINAGDNSYLPADEFDLDEDGDTSEPLPIDLDGLPRIVDGAVDLGPYEFPGPIETCEADIAPSGGNDKVDVDDLLMIINSWGPCADPNDCAADINNNDVVDVDDLLMVINNWGACP